VWGARRIHASAATEVPGGDGCHRPQHEQCAYVHGRLNDGVGPVSQLGDQHNECHKDKEQGQARDIYGGHPVAAGSGALLAFIPPELHTMVCSRIGKPLFFSAPKQQKA